MNHQNWSNDIPALNVAFLMLLRGALRESGPVAAQHFGLGSDDLAQELAELDVEQVLRLSKAMGTTPLMRLDAKAGFRLLLERVRSGQGELDEALARMGHAAADRE